MNLKEKKNDDLKKAWKKICEWTKANAANKFPGGKRFDCPHHVYYWLSLVITEDGEARIYFGSHGSDNPTWVATENNFYEPTNGRFQCGVRTVDGDNFSEEQILNACYGKTSNHFRSDCVEEIVLEWPRLVSMILSEIENNNRIANFEP